MIGTNFVRGANPVWSFVDLTGKEFDDTFWMWVLTDTIPYIPAPVYEDVSGTIPWAEPIQFLANGTLPINIYWQTDTVYRLEFRQHVGLGPPSQSDPLIYLVEDYVPTGALIEPTVPSSTITDNLITNGQFAFVNSGGSITLNNVTNPAPIEVAPGWFLNLVGTGSVTVTQVPLNTTIPTPTNAPYALEINLTGSWTSQPILYQRFYQNGQNWQGKYVSTSLTGQIQGPGANQIIARLVASNGQNLGVLLTADLTSSFVEYTGYELVPTYANLNIPPSAYIDYQILFPLTGNFYLTSLQLLVTEVAGTYEYEQDTVNRQLDHLFNYYSQKLQYKTTNSYLVGWDFPMNPAQLGTSFSTQATGVNTGFYTWDQTIVYQTLTSGVSVSRATNGGLLLTIPMGGNTGQVALIQYLDAITANKILSDKASVRISGSSTHANGLTGSVTLWATTNGSLPNVASGTNLTLVTGLGANGVPSGVVSGWTQIPNTRYNTSFILNAASATNSEDADIILNGWNIAGASPTNTATFFAIVVATSAVSTSDTITFNSISLCPGDIPSRPNPKSYAQTLLDCQQYYWKSFQPGTIPAQNVGLNKGNIVWTLQADTVNSSVGVIYPVPMRAVPNLTSYNPAAANAFVRNLSTGVDLLAPGMTNNNTQTCFELDVSNGGAGDAAGQRAGVHITADARFGIV